MAAGPLDAFRKQFDGEVILPGDARYETARKVWNGMIDRRPALIARCRSAADVALAIAYGRDQAIPIAVRGGGHNVAGNATVDDGIVVDLSSMKDVRVDAGARRAMAEGGVTWGEFDRSTAEHGLATTGGQISTTGVAGLTLGGGIGWLMRAYGLTCDNLLAAELVTADGRTIAASEQENADLFWGLRGGGGNFGVVTRFAYRLHPVTTVLGGLMLYPASHAATLLHRFRDLAASVPDELTLMLAFITAPPAPFVPAPLQGRAAVAIAGCATGDPARSERTIREIKGWGAPAADVFGPMPYLALQSMLDATAPAGTLNYWKSSFVDELADGAIDTVAEFAARMPVGMSQLHLNPMGGAIARVAEDATAFAHRRAAWVVNIVGMWPDRRDVAAGMQWVRTFADALRPYGSGVYVNFLGDEGDERVRAAYGAPTYARLAQLKRKYDPENVFRLNQNIRPAAERPDVTQQSDAGPTR